MIPKSPSELFALVLSHAVSRAYTEIAAAALEGPITEERLAEIERTVTATLDLPKDVANEFKTFEAEPAVARVRGQMRDFFEVARVGRTSKIAKE